MTLRFQPVAILPTLCTLGNTFCGFLAIAKVGDALLDPARFGEHVLFAAWMIFLAMVFDALDGKIARITNQASDFGAQLDSLTDLITFGVAPAFLVKAVFDHTTTAAGAPYAPKVTLLVSAIYAICATLRLARFTIETDTSEEAHEKFFGLPSPAAAGVIASTAFLMFEKGSPLADVAPETRLLLVKGWLWMLPVLGMLMVSKVEYVHLVSRWGRGRRPFLHLVAIVLAILVVVGWHELMFFVCFAGYAFAGPIMTFVERSAGRRIFAPPDDEDPDAEATPAVSALVAAGSNLGDRQAHLAFAVERLRGLPTTRVLAVSDAVETEPVGGPKQRPFLNAAILLHTTLPPEQLLAELQSIEAARGRERTVRNGPRTLDLDLVLHGSTICETATLVLPHPRFRERGFVLEPAAAIAPALVDPVTG
ncbi:MAG: 2-amino-4-hydroxy-6-hydroxymethyldihydropteridine diphosphokinase, partial [Planctomycetota bacterium JB042]